jgi:hypothetical protein
MFSYSPIEPDQSGRIVAGGQLGAAQTNAQMMADLGEDIGSTIRNIGSAAVGFAGGGPAGAAGAMQRGGGDAGGSLLSSILGAYKQKEQDKSDAKIYGNLLKIIGPAFGEQGGAIMEQYNSLESDRQKSQFGATLMDFIGPYSNLMMANRKAAITQSAPYARQQINNANIQAEEGPAGDYSYIE